MRSRYDVYLNGIALSSLNADLQVLDISYAAPAVKNTTFQLANRNGLKLSRRYVDPVSVAVSFELHIYDTQKRQIACQNVARWATNGGVLKTSDRPNQELICVCTTYPTIASAMRWTETLSVVFTAFPFPFWQSSAPIKITLTGTNESGTLFVDGSAESAYVEAQITANASLTSVSLSVGDTSLSLAGLNIPQGGVIRLYYDEDFILNIKYGDVSLLSKRTGSDDLIGKCNEYNAISVQANASVACEFSSKGAWL